VVNFANQYLDRRIHKLKTIGLTPSVKKLQFPAENVDPVHAYLVSLFDRLKHLKESQRTTQRKAKCLGKYPRPSILFTGSLPAVQQWRSRST
jgi:hypothetical protein